MGLGMKHELDPEQYKALLKELRKTGDKLDLLMDILLMNVASTVKNPEDIENIIKNCAELKKRYLNSKYGTNSI